ncbi:MAG: VIT family protein [Methylotenera sp.]|uniref:VIT1/CCC1 transporter family protein n=1 Tax=Methylotenera sp. TaxID=2051956 RepID=UPI002489F9F1|nr:VIT family protein [Methylotenera sp.]MDI1309775.1 VIT family protein [Methylotenera sp.]
MRHSEYHRSHHIGWLRAAVLGANDGIISTSSLIIGIATAHATHQNILLTGMAGLVSGAMSMAAGEYVSVSSQSDTETADLGRERDELATQPEHELEELTSIYIHRGLTPELAKQVSKQLTAHDALAAHARDELGIIDTMNARPIQAALASAATFAVGAALPLFIAFIVSTANIVPFVALTSLVFLALLGGLAAKVGGANVWIGTGRVAFWGALAMAATAGVGSLFGVAVA